LDPPVRSLASARENCSLDTGHSLDEQSSGGEVIKIRFEKRGVEKGGGRA